jgi:hypothetical protein
MTEPDPLSEALRSVRLSGAIFLDAEFTAPWGFASPPASAGARLLAPSAEHMILFHLLVEGEASARIPGQGRVALEAGDIVVLPGGAAHELWNGRVTQLTDSSELLPKLLTGAVLSERGGGGGRLTRFICGYIGCERQAKRLFLAGLPPLFKVNIRRGASGGWLEDIIRHLASEREPARAGRRALLATLAEALFIETLRQYMPTSHGSGPDGSPPRAIRQWGARSVRSTASPRAPGQSRRLPNTPECHAPFSRSGSPGCLARRHSPMSPAPACSSARGCSRQPMTPCFKSR